MLYKISFNENAEFNTLDIRSPRREGPQKFENIILAPLYHHTRPITSQKDNDMMDLLPYILPIDHDYFKKLSLCKKKLKMAHLI